MIETAYLPHFFLLIAGAAVIAAGRLLPRRATWGPAAFICLLIAAWLFATGFEQRSKTATSAPPMPPHINGGETRVPPSQALPFQQALTGFGLLLAGVVSMGLWHAHECTELSAESQGLVLIAIAGALLTVAGEEVWLSVAGVEVAGLVGIALRYTLNDSTERKAILRRVIVPHGFSLILLLIAVGLLTVLLETSQLSAMAAHRSGGDTEDPGVWIHVAFVLLFAAMAIRLRLVPFHFGTTEGDSSTSNEAALAVSTLPAFAVLIFLYRVGFEALPGLESTAVAVSLVLSGGTMVVGGTLAIAQTSVRATLNSLAMSYAGTIIFGLSIAWGQAHPESLSSPGMTSLTRGEVVWGLYLFTGLISFAGLSVMLIDLESHADTRSQGFQKIPGIYPRVEYVEQLQGLYRNRPLVAIALIVFLLNLVGVPPLPGFWARWTALLATFSIQRATPAGGSPHWGFVAVAGLMLLQSLLLAVVAFRWISAMVIEPSLSRQQPRMRLGALYAGLICLVLTILVGLAPSRALKQLETIMGPAKQVSTAPE